MTIARSRLGTRLAGAGLLLVLVACGDDTSPTTVPTPVPPTPSSGPATPPPAVLVVQGQEALPAPPNPKGGTTVVKWDVTTPAAGTVGVTISYLYDISKLHVWMTDRLCNKWQFERDECFYLAKSLDGPRPRTLSASGVKAGSYTLFVANDGPLDEVVGYKVTLVPDSSSDGRLQTGPAAPSGRR